MAFSKSDVINETVRQLIRRGWKAERGGKHWKVFSPKGDHRFIVPSTPSDFRSEKNWLADVRRKLKEREEDYSFMKPDNFSNTPLVREPQKFIVREEPKPIVPVATRPLVDEDEPRVRQLIAEGKTYADIAVILGAMGYVLRRGPNSGQPITLAAVQQIVHKWNTRNRETPVAAPVLATQPAPQVELPRETPPAPQVAVVKKEHPLLTMVMEIVSSNLNDDMKENVLQVMARDWMTKGKV